MRHMQKNRGIALITAILITAIISLVAFNLLSRQQIDTRRTMNSLHWQQAYLYSTAVEAWGMQLLVRDAKDTATNKFDHESETWATEVGTLAVDDGQITGEIQDLQGRFNVNNLADAVTGEPNQAAKEQFIRLLETLEINQPDLADKLIDWIDKDENPGLNGAEDGEYLSQEIPYRTPNLPMTSITELRLVQGVTPEIYRKLEPYLTALPTRTLINVNTAAAPVLRSLTPEISLSAAESLIENRESAAFETPADFEKEAKAVAGAKLTIPPNSIGVQSNYFLIKSKASFGDGFANLSSIIARDLNGAGIHVVMRSQER